MSSSIEATIASLRTSTATATMISRGTEIQSVHGALQMLLSRTESSTVTTLTTAFASCLRAQSTVFMVGSSRTSKRATAKDASQATQLQICSKRTISVLILSYFL